MQARNVKLKPKRGKIQAKPRLSKATKQRDETSDVDDESDSASEAFHRSRAMPNADSNGDEDDKEDEDESEDEGEDGDDHEGVSSDLPNQVEDEDDVEAFDRASTSKKKSQLSAVSVNQAAKANPDEDELSDEEVRDRQAFRFNIHADPRGGKDHEDAMNTLLALTLNTLEHYDGIDIHIRNPWHEQHYTNCKLLASALATNAYIANPGRQLHLEGFSLGNVDLKALLIPQGSDDAKERNANKNVDRSLPPKPNKRDPPPRLPARSNSGQTPKRTGDPEENAVPPKKKRKENPPTTTKAKAEDIVTQIVAEEMRGKTGSKARWLLAKYEGYPEVCCYWIREDKIPNSEPLHIWDKLVADRSKRTKKERESCEAKRTRKNQEQVVWLEEEDLPVGAPERGQVLVTYKKLSHVDNKWLSKEEVRTKLLEEWDAEAKQVNADIEEVKGELEQ